jgi:hypothetical protein
MTKRKYKFIYSHFVAYLMQILNKYIFYRLGLVFSRYYGLSFPYVRSVEYTVKSISTVICRTEGQFVKRTTLLESTPEDLQNGTHFNNF